MSRTVDLLNTAVRGNRHVQDKSVTMSASGEGRPGPREQNGSPFRFHSTKGLSCFAATGRSNTLTADSYDTLYVWDCAIKAVLLHILLRNN